MDYKLNEIEWDSNHKWHLEILPQFQLNNLSRYFLPIGLNHLSHGARGLKGSIELSKIFGESWNLCTWSSWRNLQGYWQSPRSSDTNHLNDASFSTAHGLIGSNAACSGPVQANLYLFLSPTIFCKDSDRNTKELENVFLQVTRKYPPKLVQAKSKIEGDWCLG